VHPGAEDHFRVRPSPLIWLALFAFGLLAAGWWRDPLAIRRGLAAGSLAWVIAASLAGIWVLLSLAMMRAEGRINPSFSTVSEAFASTFGVVTRFRDIPLMTPEGEIWRWLGLLVFPVILGWLFSDVLKDCFRLAAAKLAKFIQNAQARDAHVLLVAIASRLRRSAEWIAGKPRARGALVFLNWNGRAEQIAGELQEDPALADRPIVIVEPGGAPSRLGDRFACATVVVGDPATRAAMERAGILEASAVTIVSNWIPADPGDRRRHVDPEYADSKTLLTILAIRALCEDRNRSTVLPIRAEIQLARNQQEATSAAQGGPLALTVLPSSQASAFATTTRRLRAFSA
jgi:voltage-gated potassium channel Kch